MPWDVVVNRLDRFMRLGYLLAVLAGLILMAEILVLVLPGDAEHRRDQIAEAVEDVAAWKVDLLVVVFLIASAIVAAYFVGVVARTLTFIVLQFVQNTYSYSLFEGRQWWRNALEGEPERLSAAQRRARQLSQAWTEFKGPPYRPRPSRLRRFGGILRDAFTPILPRPLTLDILWPTLEHAHGKEAVNRALARHPITVRVGANESRIWQAFDYCQLWLQRYAKDVAVPMQATRLLVLGTTAIPVVLLPSSLDAIANDVSGIPSSAGWIWLVLIAGAFVLSVGGLREGRSQGLATFQRFVMVQLTEAAAPGGSDDVLPVEKGQPEAESGT
jgi:hypothetical protein